MTESKPNYEIIPKDFQETQIEFINYEDELWVTAKALGEGLEYNNPRISIMNLYSRHMDEIEEFSTVIELVTGDQVVETRIFTERGAYLLVMFSNQPLAKEFRKWLSNVVKEIRQTGSYNNSLAKLEVGSTDWIIQQLDAMRSMALKQKATEEKILQIEDKVGNVDSEIKSFEKRYEEERIITPQTKRKIQDLVHLCVIRSGHHYAVFHKLYKDKFGISAYKDAPEKLGQKLLHWMVEHPEVKPHIKGLDLAKFLDFDYGFKEDKDP